MSEFKSWEEMSELEQLACEYWDFYKEAHGVRPRHVNTSGWTVEDYQREFEVLSGISEANAAQRRTDEERAAHDLEVRIQSLMVCGAKDREMAIRWLDEAEGAGGDREYLCFLLGVRYGYFTQPVVQNA
jgi:hypothetical protein